MNKNPLGLPRNEDITEINFGNRRIATVRLTKENREEMLKLALSMYIGEQCKFCHRVYGDLEDLQDVVWAGGEGEYRLSCKLCWQENNNQ